MKKLTHRDLIRFQEFAKSAYLEISPRAKLEDMNRSLSPSELTSVAFLNAALLLLNSHGIDTMEFQINLDHADSEAIE